MVRPDSTGFYLMDGSSQRLYLNGNTDVTFSFKSAKSDVTDSNKRLITPIDGNRPLRADQLPFTWRFQTVDDMPKEDKDPELYHGYATWEISSPKELFKTYTVSVELASGIIQPEANTYVVKADSRIGILIPVSQVNKAADYYNWLVDYDMAHDPYGPGQTKESELDILNKRFVGNSINIKLDHLDDDDPFEPWLIWTDLGSAKKKDGTIDQSLAGVKRIRSVSRPRADGKGEDRYIYFLPSAVESNGKLKGGSVLIGARSGKIEGAPNLWSWHIWLVREYPKMYHSLGQVALTGSDKRKYANPSIWMLDRNLGADTKGSGNYNDEPDAMGFAYQWGRKDPFPWTNQIISPSNGKPREFWDGEGNPFSFPENLVGTRENRGYKSVAEGRGGTLTMKESVRRPYVLVAHQSVWMTEHLPFNTDPDKILFTRATWHWIWETPFIDGSEPVNLKPRMTTHQNTAMVAVSKGVKSPFDPSPYGMRLPKYDELDLLRYIFYYEIGPDKVYNVKTGTLYDGSYENRADKRPILIGGAAWTNPDQLAKGNADRYAGSHLKNTEANNLGWTDGSTKDYLFRRAMGMAIRPVADVPYDKKSTPTDDWIYENIYKYWPEYKK